MSVLFKLGGFSHKLYHVAVRKDRVFFHWWVLRSDLASADHVMSFSDGQSAASFVAVE